MFGVELFSDRTLTLSNYLSGKCGHSNNAKWFTVVYFWFENNLKPDLDDLAPSCASYTGLDEVWMNYFFFFLYWQYISLVCKETFHCSSNQIET